MQMLWYVNIDKIWKDYLGHIEYPISNNQQPGDDIYSYISQLRETI